MQQDIRKIIQAVYCMPYCEFLKAMNLTDDYYAKAKFKEAQKDFGKWFCSLDSNMATKICNHVFKEKLIYHTGGVCRKCGDKPDILYTTEVCGDCK